MLGLLGWTAPVQAQVLLEFSLDIGSDKELSDPQADLDEAFDPGDVYAWPGAPVLYPGVNGFKDDGARIFGTDPPPFPPLPDTPVPIGVGLPPTYSYYGNWFDLDGHDQLDLNLKQYIPWDDMPLVEPIPKFASNCIHDARYLLISYEDDQAPGWIWPGVPGTGDVPVWTLSPAGLIHGTTANQDEVVGLDMVWSPPPMAVGATYGYADELTVHPSLAPNPDPPPAPGNDAEDDDVDSPVASATQEMLKERIDMVLKTLSYREREIIKLRYGIGDGYTYTLEEVGRIFKVTRERVRQVEAKAIRKLQHPVRARKLEGFLDHKSA